MKKVAKIFKMMKWIAVRPGISVGDLANLVGVSHRGIYRYIDDLRGLCIPITKCRGGGYYLQDADILNIIRLTGNGDDEVVDVEIQELPFTYMRKPGVIYTEIGPGSPARVRYEVGAEVSPEEGVILEPTNSLQVHLAADGVKLEAVDEDRGLGSVVVRWW